MEEVRALPPDEQRQVKDLLDALLQEPASPSPEDLLNQQLLQAGLLKRIPPRTVDPNRPPFKPIKVQGKPVSETIIEERR
ncbi:MAG TPA: hypothetical protein VNO70_05495 [Blastocatellia bacterium]|nr:hypothetical protein [Blastocatellia bacterium]